MSFIAPISLPMTRKLRASLAEKCYILSESLENPYRDYYSQDYETRIAIMAQFMAHAMGLA